MSNFANEIRGSGAFFGGQDAYYGIKSGEAHLVSQSSTENRGRTTQRKPVGSGSRQNQQSPYPPVLGSTPARKPVGSDRTKSSASGRAQPSASGSRGSNPPNLNKALPRTPLPFIGRDSSGRFDPKTRQIDGNAPQSPIGRNEQPVTIPRQAQALLQSSAGSAPPTPGRVDSRPTSSSGWSFKGRKRTDSNLSGTSSQAGSRRGSISDAAKSAGKWAKGKADILAMNKADRDNFMKGHKKQHDREVEVTRQQDPLSRPQYQKEYLVEKQRAAKPGESWGLGGVEASYAAQMEERAFRTRVANGHRRIHEEKVRIAHANGKPRPFTPEEAKLSPPAGSMNSRERSEARRNSNASSEEGFSGFSKADRFALLLSKKLDNFKIGRKGSESSDMDFGMTDAAPAGSMYLCGEVEGPNFGKGCHMPSATSLKAGLCEQCYAFAKYEHRNPSPTPSRIKGHNPKSPEDDANGGDLYIHLPNQHRLRKVRDTMYDDPGNPFASEGFDLPLLPTTRYQITESELTDNEDDDPFDEWESDPPADEEPSKRAENEIYSMLSDPFDLVNTHASVLLNRQTMRSSQSQRRSMSVDIGFMPHRGTTEQRSDHSFGQLPPKNIPSLHIQRPSGAPDMVDPKRDTKFYDFYDSVLAEYGVQINMDTLEPKAAVLSASY